MAGQPPPCKKPRMSDDDMKPRTSDEDGNEDDDQGTVMESPRSPLVEVLSPDEIGTTVHTAIRLDDDDDDDDDDYSSTVFSYRHHFDHAGSALKDWQFLVNSNNYLQPFHLADCNSCIDLHLQHSRHDPPDVYFEKYRQDGDFFDSFGMWLLSLLDTTNVVEDTPLKAAGHVKPTIAALYTNATEMSIRILTILPDIISATLRRDYGQEPGQITQKRNRKVPLMVYVGVLARLLSKDCAATQSFEQSFGTSLDAITRNCLRRVERMSDIAQILLTVLDLLLQDTRAVQSSWEAISDSMSVLDSMLSFMATGEVERLLQIISQAVIPEICGKHPRMLPSKLHSSACDLGSRLLSFLATKMPDQNERIYRSFISSARDALFPASDGTVADQLERIKSGAAARQIPNLFRASWKVQILIKYIVDSDIMDIRHLGVRTLAEELVSAYNFYQENPETPVLRLLARSLQLNGLIKFLFGPNSHAMLLKESGNIIAFLSATNNFANPDLDIIWHAAVSSAEIEFTQACFNVLGQVSAHLDVDTYLYLIQKYASESVSKLQTPFVDFLQQLFARLQEKRQCDVEAALLTVNMLEHFDMASVNNVTLRLHAVALTELSRVFNNASMDQRMKLYECIGPKINSCANSASTDLDIMNMFLTIHPPLGIEAERIINLLSVESVVEGLGVSKHSAVKNDTSLRMEVAFRLLSLSPESPDDSILEELWRRAVTETAAASREQIWYTLDVMTNNDKLRPMVTECLLRFAPALEDGYASKGLVRLLKRHVEKELQTPAAYATLTKLSTWSQLMRFALENSSGVASDARQAICDILFHQKRQGSGQARSAVVCRLLDKDFHDPARFACTVDIIEAMLCYSRDATRFEDRRGNIEVVLACEDNGGGDVEEEQSLDFHIQLYGPVKQDSFYIRAVHPSTKVSTVAKALAEHAGTKRFTAMLNGTLVPIDEDCDITLAKANIIGSSGRLTIRPLYSVDDDLFKALTSIDPLEQLILLHYERIEPLLDIPVYAADAYRLLSTLPKPANIQRKIEMTNNCDLFPVERPFRAIYSMDVMSQQYEDYRSLGIKDQQTFERGTMALMQYIECSNVDVGSCLTAMRKLKDVYLSDPEAEVKPTSTLQESLKSFIKKQAAAAAVPIVSDAYPRPPNEILALSVLMRMFQKTSTFWDRSLSDKEWINTCVLLLLDRRVYVRDKIADVMELSCKESGDDGSNAMEFYLRVTMATVPLALSAHCMSSGFTKLFRYCINNQTRRREGNIRNIVQDLEEHLRTYQHLESFHNAFTDETACGLLQNLSAAISALKSFKRPLGLDSLVLHIWTELLFPPLTKDRARPLLTETSRLAATDVLHMAADDNILPSTRNALLIGAINAIQEMSMTEHDPQIRELGPGTKASAWLRLPYAYVGLKNYSQTCYVNSLLQQLFANLELRKFLLDTPVVNEEKQMTLVIVQRLFARMQDSAAPYQHTHDLLQHLNISKLHQDDAHQFYAQFMHVLGESMPDKQYKGLFQALFTGEQVTQTRGDCGHVSHRVETFIDVPIVVKNKATLIDSLKASVQGEPLQGSDRYRCETCDPEKGGNLVDAMRRTCLRTIPDNLTLTLKRFSYDVSTGDDDKVNDRFEFPAEIDMSPYKLETLDHQEKCDTLPDTFELVGVVVHHGSMSFGHYWSFVRLQTGSEMGPRPIWVRVEDQLSRVVDFKDVLDAGYGGPDSNGEDRGFSAYVLLYKRHRAVEDPLSVIPNDPISVPGSPMPEHLANEIELENRLRYRIAHLFGNFAEIVKWLHDMMSPVQSLLACRLVTLYLARVSIRRVDEEQTVFQSMLLQLRNNPDTYGEMLAVARQEGMLEGSIWMFHRPQQQALNSLILSAVKNMIIKARESVQEETPQSASSPIVCSETVKFTPSSIDDGDFGTSHTSPANSTAAKTAWEIVQQTATAYMESLRVLETTTDVPRWQDHLLLGVEMANISREMAASLFDLGFLRWVLTAMNFRKQEIRAREKRLAQLKNRLPLETVFDAALALLELVDLETLDNYPPGETWFAHGVSPNGRYRIHPYDADLLLAGKASLDPESPSWLTSAVVLAKEDVPWTEYWPGKLVQRLSGPDVHHQLRHSIQIWLLDAYRNEQEKLAVLRHLSMYFVQGQEHHDNETIGSTLPTFINELRHWNVDQVSSVRWLSEVSALGAYATVLRHMPHLAAQWLLDQSKLVQRKTREYLTKHIFDFLPITASSGADEAGGPVFGGRHDAVRTEAVRKLCSKLVPVLWSACCEGAPSAKYNNAVAVTEASLKWLRALLTVSEGKQLVRALSVQRDETRATVADVERTLSEYQAVVSDDTDVPVISGAARTGDSSDEEITMEYADTDMEEEDFGASGSDASSPVFGG